MSSIELIKAFQTLGCRDDLKCAVASMVYLDLKEVHKLSDIEPHFDEQLDLLYFRGQRENCLPEVIVPVSSLNEIDLVKLADIQTKFNPTHKSVSLAICDPNSTILYYTISNQFIDK